ncbi:hypothetical protein RI844_14800 [Thalassotalea fonticola]|uniref:Uncharacterized protein n=1 Tax=Thalassotalea fonticola TaxID=3065649 RepID=A0ABZ0GL48_9GAMM|nr:hypothetical protein RI844_14800 [Colwelliaceae bacterium S1-1]
MKLPFIGLILLAIALGGSYSFASDEISFGENFVHFQALNSLSEHASIVVPFKNEVLDLTQKLQLTINGKSVKFDAQSSLIWPSKNNNKPFLRSLLLTPFSGVRKGDIYKLTWHPELGKQIAPYDNHITKTIDAKFPIDWLSNVLYAPLLAPISDDFYWFNKAYINYSDFVTDDKAIAEHKKIQEKLTDPAPWLYDRVYVLYQLYFKTGDITIKHKAHEAALFYQQNLTEQGYFGLKKNADHKYLLNTGLLIDYMFYPRLSLKKAIHKIFINTLSWPSKYTQKVGFWTERNLAVALAAAITQWELNQSITALVRIQDLVDGTSSALYSFNANTYDCIAHPYGVHEGGKADDLVCSPWMSALASYQFWRLFQLSGNEKSKNIIKSLGKSVLRHGTYTASDGQIKGRIVPKYLIFLERPTLENNEQWSDIQHACDVAGMVSLSAYLSKLDGEDITQLVRLADKLLLSCQHSLQVNDKNRTRWQLSPVRKFNWWFGTTGNMPWVLTELAEEFESAKLK